ncbi:MAG: DUF3445 domain-containing protein [Planctomycetaceae bacterium]
MADLLDVPYFPFDENGYRLSVGLAPLPSNRWMEPDRLAVQQLRLRGDLLTSHREDVLQYRAESAAACLELNRAVRRHLLEHHPNYACGTEQHIRIASTQVVLPPPANGLQGLEQLAHLVQEDFCILSSESNPTLIAALVCFPSHWKLQEKMGQTSDAIHAVVPKFADKLAIPTNAILSKLRPNRPVWRINWSIDGDDSLFTPGPKSFRDDLSVRNVLHSTWLRAERQTLRRLPETGSLVFTIRTYLHRMADVAVCPNRRTKLLASLRTMAPDTAAYKGMVAMLPLLIEALERLG